MPLTSNPPTKRVPHSKSERARAAEIRGEHTWRGWRLAELIEQVLRWNRGGLTAKDLRRVKNLEYLKVKLLFPRRGTTPDFACPSLWRSSKTNP